MFNSNRRNPNPRRLLAIHSLKQFDEYGGFYFYCVVTGHLGYLQLSFDHFDDWQQLVTFRRGSFDFDECVVDHIRERH